MTPASLSPSQLGTATHHLLERALTTGKAPAKLVGEPVVADWGSEGAHATLSPSSAHRWLACPGSIALMSALPPDQTKRLETRATAEMASCAAVAVAYLRPLLTTCTASGVESKVPIPATKEFGTVDAWCLRNEDGALVLYVVDYKNGREHVSPKANPQLMLYAQGVINRTLHYHKGKDIKVILVIVGPNMAGNDAVQEWATTKRAILQWCAGTVAPVVRTIADGTACLRPGAHCKRCRAAPCIASAKAASSACRQDWAEFVRPGAPLPDRPLKPAELVQLVLKADLVRAVLKAADEKAFALLAKDPSALPGLKLVEGASKRRWTNPDDALAYFKQAGLQPDAYAPRKLEPFGRALALLPVGKRADAEAKLLEKPRGRAVVAPASDDRPPMQRGAAYDFQSDIDDTELD